MVCGPAAGKVGIMEREGKQKVLRRRRTTENEEEGKRQKGEETTELGGLNYSERRCQQRMPDKAWILLITMLCWIAKGLEKCP